MTGEHVPGEGRRALLRLCVDSLRKSRRHTAFGRLGDALVELMRAQHALGWTLGKCGPSLATEVARKAVNAQLSRLIAELP